MSESPNTSTQVHKSPETKLSPIYTQGPATPEPRHDSLRTIHSLGSGWIRVLKGPLGGLICLPRDSAVGGMRRKREKSGSRDLGGGGKAWRGDGGEGRQRQ